MTAGRPTSYKPEYAKQAAFLCERGATHAELADFFEVSISTITQWVLREPEFSSSVKLAKEIADQRVEESLYKRAMGYEHDEVDLRVVGGELVQTPIRKYYPPDAISMIFWLKNRKKNQWRDKQEVEHTGDAIAALLGQLSNSSIKPTREVDDD